MASKSTTDAVNTTFLAPVVVAVVDGSPDETRDESMTIIGKASAAQCARWAKARRDATRGEAMKRAGAESVVRAAITFAAAYGDAPTLPRLADVVGAEIGSKRDAWAMLHGRGGDPRPGDAAAASRALNAGRAAAILGEDEALRIGSIEALDAVVKAHDERAAAAAAAGRTDAQAVADAKRSTRAAAKAAAKAGATGRAAAKAIADSVAPERAAQVEERAEAKATRAAAGRAAVNGEPDAVADAVAALALDGDDLHRGRCGTLGVALGVRMGKARLAAFAASLAAAAANMD